MKKILFVATHRPDRAPNQRFRFEQYLEYLSQHGFHYDISYLLNEKDDHIFYRPKNYFLKSIILAKAAMHRLKDIQRAQQYDIIFISREAYLTGSTFFERKFSKSEAKIMYDFDDAIWHLDVSEANKNFGWMKNPGKTAHLISTADLVIAGNSYLADYAKHHNDHVIIIPTTVDTDRFRKIPFQKENDRCFIGWSGSITTTKHFKFVVPVLKKIKEKYGPKVGFRIMGDPTIRFPDLDIHSSPWKKEHEIGELSAYDIGIMPLPDNEWEKGKCGFKALLYMSFGIPAVASPVGVNTEIIQDGVNGFLASSEEEWVTKLSALIESEDLRKKLGAAGRQTVVEKYSFHSQKEKYLKCFNEVLEK